MNKQEARSFVEKLSKQPNQRAAAAAFGVAQSTVSERFAKCKRILGDKEVRRLMGDAYRTYFKEAPAMAAAFTAAAAAGQKNVTAVPTPEEAPSSRAPHSKVALGDAVTSGDPAVLQMKLLEEEIKRLRGQNKQMAETALSEELIRKHIFKVAEYKPIPDWVVSAKIRKSVAVDSSPGVPTLFASDWHWGEMVNPAEIGGVNEFNMRIGRERAHRLIETSIELLTKHTANPVYPGIVFALGGDMVSGNIHEELSETNEVPIMQTVMDVSDVLTGAIYRLKEVFGRVFLPCVCGNHGRLHRKPRAKESNFSSYDWLIYQLLNRVFENDPDVVFYIPDGPDALVQIAGHKYLFTHGDQFRGGDGMIGALGPIIRGDHKKRSRNGQIGHEYDTLVIGHFHQLIQMRRVIVNGSLVGYNEYAFKNNFGFEPAQQALWLTHPDHGVTLSMPVLLAERPNRGTRGGSKDWVSFCDSKKAP